MLQNRYDYVPGTFYSARDGFIWMYQSYNSLDIEVEGQVALKSLVYTLFSNERGLGDVGVLLYAERGRMITESPTSATVGNVFLSSKAAIGGYDYEYTQVATLAYTFQGKRAYVLIR